VKLGVVDETVRRAFGEGALPTAKKRVKGRRQVWLIAPAALEQFRGGQ
jgi:hypothetical protein